MRLAAALFFAGLVVSFSPAAPPKKWVPPAGPLGDARQRLLHGNYAEARAGFEPLLSDDATRPAAAIGISRAWCGEGEYDKALAALDAAVAKSPNSADLNAARADLLFERGKWDEAAKAADAALAKDKDNFLARWVKARIARDSGDLPKADTDVRWFVRTYSARSQADNDVTDPDDLAIVGHAGAENARWHNISRQFSFILNEVYGDALKADKDFWWAEYYAGMMLLEKYNRPDAVEAFDKALKINPKAAEPFVGKGLAALQKFDLKEAEEFADKALKINPRLPAALRLRAELHLMANESAEAEARLLAAKAVNPRDAATLGRLAGCYAAERKPEAVAAVVKDAESYDAKPGQFYYEYAESLEERKQYVLAEDLFKKAADLRPMLIGPRNSLGLLYLRLGQETEGKEVLAAAFKADPFNVRVANMIKVMKHLDKYDTRKTPHFVIRFDPAHDKLLIEFMADYLEQTYAQLKRQYGYEPPQPILFEVFKSHEMFSGRTIGLPDLHTIGASTGRIVAIASPAAEGLRRPFNWGRVIRHELTHIFNLSQTNFFCPHWLTEGLAVRNEHMTRPIEWTKLLLEAQRAGKLFNLDNVMLGFVRPRTPDEWTLAYCQSNLYVEFLVKTYGEGAVSRMLDVYKTGADTDTALRQACGVEKPAFEQKYKAFLADLLKPYTKAETIRLSDESPMTLDELVSAHKKNPDDLDLSARLADAYSRRDQNRDARKLV
ncbi:MAG TPA: tetratricopeptide repeat protein, partial [Fimbriiglobus sp.]